MSQQGPFVITGPVGGAPNRLEINDFVKDETMFSLYIQALSTLWHPFHVTVHFIDYLVQRLCPRRTKMTYSPSSKSAVSTAFPTSLGTARAIMTSVSGVGTAPTAMFSSLPGTGHMLRSMKYAASSSL